MICTDNEHLIITVKSSPVKKTEETGTGLPVKDLFGGIEEEALVEFSPAISYQKTGYVKYSLDFCGLNGTHVEDRRNPTALEKTFKFWEIFESYQNSTCRAWRNKNQNIAPQHCKNSKTNTWSFFSKQIWHF